MYERASPDEPVFLNSVMLTVRRYLVIVLLLAAVCLEGYYIFVLNDTIQRQAEDLRSISAQLQFLKSERESLNEEISSATKHADEEGHGTAIQR